MLPFFERTCREYGITARLTKRRSPTTTGKIERFHRTLRRELLDETGAFDTIETAQTAIDEWVHAYNTCRPHQSLNMATPASVFRSRSTDPDTMPSKPVGAEIRPEAEVVLWFPRNRGGLLYAASGSVTAVFS